MPIAISDTLIVHILQSTDGPMFTNTFMASGVTQMIYMNTLDDIFSQKKDLDCESSFV